MAGIFRSGYQAAANAVWSLVAVGSRTVTVTTNNDKSAYAGTVKSIQHGTISIGTDEASHSSTISSVNTSSAIIIPMGNDHGANSNNNNPYRLYFTSSTVVTAIRNLDQSATMPAGTIGYTVVEYY